MSAPDRRAYQSTATNEWNIWYQFQIVQRDTYLRTGAMLVDSIMKKRNDPRLAAYFSTITPPAWAASHKYKPRTKILDSNGNMEQVTAVTLDSTSGAAAPGWNTTLYGTTTDNHLTWTDVRP